MTRNKSIEGFNSFVTASGLLFYRLARLEATLADMIRCYLADKLAPHEATNSELKEAMLLSAAVFHSHRMSNIRDAIKGIARAVSDDAQAIASLDSILHHAGELQYLRDRLAHYETLELGGPHPDLWINSNIGATKNIMADHQILVPVESIVDACFDAVEITNCLAKLFTVSEGRSLLNVPEKPPAWQYKPSQLIRERRAIAKILREHPDHVPPWGT